MSLSVGIVGLPNVGKSTLFNALTKKSVPAENYPFCTIDPSVGIVGVPDERLRRLSEFSHSQKSIPAAIEFVDIAGLVEGASKGEGLGNQFLANIREVDAILHIVRLFELEDKSGKLINHVYGSVDPKRDIEVITMELALADLQTIEKRSQAISREVKRGDKEAVQFHALLERLRSELEVGNLISSLSFTEQEVKLLKTLHLLTAKPVLFGLNKNSNADNYDDLYPDKFKELTDWILGQQSRYVVIDAGTEFELKDFSAEEKFELREELGSDADGIDLLIREAYTLLGLMTYFTTGETETRAWTIPVGSTAPEAGSAIHTDFQDKFIRADVIHCDDLLNAGSYAEARSKGLLRTEGKGYIVHDGDVIEFRI